MKWVTVISCFFLITFAECKNSALLNLPRRYRDVGPGISIADFIPLPENIVKLGIVSLLAQFVKNATFEELDEAAKNIIALAKVCNVDSELDPRCEKYVGDACADVLCEELGLAEKYGFTECCTAANQERYRCFLKYKNQTPEFSGPVPHQSIGEICNKFQGNEDVFKTKNAYEIARRYPETSLYTIIKGVNDYGDVLTQCCAKTFKWQCFVSKASVVAAKFRDASYDQQYMCTIEKKYKPENLYHCKFAELNKKFPKGRFSVLYYLAGRLQAMYNELCQGNTLQDLIGKIDILYDICFLRLNVSPNLDKCCGKLFVDQPRCIEALEDDKPTDLSPIVKEFIEDVLLQCRAEKSTSDWTQDLLLYEYSRGHFEFSMEPVTQLYEGYVDLLQKCCQTVRTGTCGSEAEKQLETQTEEILKSKKDICIFDVSGKNFFYQDMILPEFTRRLPQLPFEELYNYTKKFTEGVDQCCRSNDSQRLSCIEVKVDTVLEDICQRHEAHFINSQIGRCCREQHHCLLKCFQNIGAAAYYMRFSFFPVVLLDVCSADSPDDQHLYMQRLLVNLVKSNPDVTKEAQTTIITEYRLLVTECCQTEKKEECFKEKGHKLIELIKAASGRHLVSQVSRSGNMSFF